MSNLQDKIVDAKDNLPNITPVPPSFHTEATVHELKSRLQWGEPGLTIVDARSHDDFNQSRIQGAINSPLEQIAEIMSGRLLPDRDIYVYGGNESETSDAANQLRELGFKKVAKLKGGLAAWKEIEGAVEGVGAFEDPGADAYNVFSRLEAFKQEKAKEQRVK